MKYALILSIVLNIFVFGYIIYLKSHPAHGNTLNNPEAAVVNGPNGIIRLWKYKNNYQMNDKSGKVSATSTDDHGGITVTALGNSEDEIIAIWLDKNGDGIFDAVMQFENEIPITKNVVIGDVVNN